MHDNSSNEDSLAGCKLSEQLDPCDPETWIMKVKSEPVEELRRKNLVFKTSLLIFVANSFEFLSRRKVDCK